MLNKRLNDMGGISEILTQGISHSISFESDIEIEGYESLRYSLRFEPKGQSYSISKETLSQAQSNYSSEPFKYIESSCDDIRYFDTSTKRLVRPGMGT